MPKIYYLNELEEFYGEEEWKMQIEVSDIWNKVSKNEINFEQFNKEYAQRIIKYKKNILDLGNDVWNDIVPLINEMSNKKTKEESYGIYESIYDWADKNSILIKTK
jgi:aspartate-semialdehyde dehydrogenase